MESGAEFTLQMHRMVQEAIRDDLGKTLAGIAEQAYSALAQAGPGGDFQFWPQLDRLLPHQRVCAQMSQRYSLYTGTIAEVLNQLAFYLDGRGEYKEAEPLYQQALTLRRAALPEGHPDIAQSLNNLALLYKSQGRYAEAEPLFQQAIDMLLAALGPRHPNTIAGLGNYLGMMGEQNRQAEILVFLTARPGLLETFQLWMNPE